MDSFQGCYQNNPRDCRYFAAVYLMLRIALFIAYSVTLSQLNYLLDAALTILTAIVVAIVKPYKSSVQNVVLLLILALGWLSCSANILADIVDSEFLQVSYVMLYAAGSVPLIHLLALLFHTLFCQRPAIKRIIQRVVSFATNRRNSTDSMESLRHRIDHAEEYTNHRAMYGSIDSTPAV